MRKSNKARMAMMAATSLIAATAALGSAHADEIGPAAAPSAAIATPLAPDIAHAADHSDREGPTTAAKRWALAAIGAGALAGLVRLIGVKKVIAALSIGAKKTARMTAKTAARAATAVGRAAASPLRFAALLAGLALFALAGVGFYDVEWIGGLIVGGAMIGVAVHGAMKMRAALRPKRVKSEPGASGQTEINQ